MLSFGMSFTLDDRFTSVARNIESSMNRLDGVVNRTAEGVNRLYQRSSNLAQSGAASIRASANLLTPLRSALEIGGDFERGQLQLRAFIGNAQEAMYAFKNIKEDALKMPMAGFKELLQANSLFIASGESADKARETVQLLSNAVMLTGGNSQNLANVAYNMNQIAQTNKATQMDVRQFANNQIPFISTYKKLFGKSPLAENVKVTYSEARKVFEYIKKNYNIIDEIMNSINGQTAMFRENIQYALGNIGTAVAPVFVPLAKAANEILETIQAFVETPVGKFVARVAASLLIVSSASLALFGAYKLWSGALGMFMASRIKIFGDIMNIMTKAPALFSAGFWGRTFSTVTTAVGTSTVSMAAAFGELTAVMQTSFYAIVSRLIVVVTLINSADEGLVTLGITLGLLSGKFMLITTLIVAMHRANKNWGEYVKSDFKRSLEGTFGFFAKVGGVAKGLMETMGSITKQGFSMSGETAFQLSKAGILDTVITLSKIVFQLSHMMTGFLQGISFVLEVFTSALSLIGSIFLSVYNAVYSLFDTIRGFFGGKKTGGKDANMSMMSNMAGKVLGVIAALMFLRKYFLVVGAALKVTFWPILKHFVAAFKVFLVFAKRFITAIGMLMSKGSATIKTRINQTSTTQVGTHVPISSLPQQRQAMNINRIQMRMNQPNPIGVIPYNAQSSLIQSINKGNTGSLSNTYNALRTNSKQTQQLAQIATNTANTTSSINNMNTTLPAAVTRQLNRNAAAANKAANIGTSAAAFNKGVVVQQGFGKGGMLGQVMLASVVAAASSVGESNFMKEMLTMVSMSILMNAAVSAFASIGTGLGAKLMATTVMTSITSALSTAMAAIAGVTAATAATIAAIAAAVAGLFYWIYNAWQRTSGKTFMDKLGNLFSVMAADMISVFQKLLYKVRSYFGFAKESSFEEYRFNVQQEHQAQQEESRRIDLMTGADLSAVNSYMNRAEDMNRVRDYNLGVMEALSMGSPKAQNGLGVIDITLEMDGSKVAKIVRNIDSFTATREA